MNPKLTDAGKNLLLRALTGETINFKRIELGDGAAQQPEAAPALLSPRLTASISDFTLGENYVTLTALFNNSAVDTGFRITEAGFFAEDPDDATHEILYALGNASVASADYVPARTERVLEMQYNAVIYIGDAENVTAAISGSLVYATKEALDAHLDCRTNPHGVTKAQIGLGNVPNVTTNDQTPTYDENAALSDLRSGEKLSGAFAKIKASISALIQHLRNKSNPHGVTAAQIGAAKLQHGHSADEIYTGVLPVDRGGTGLSAPADGGILRGNGSGALTALRGIGALYALKTGNPQFGVLPWQAGGTGCSSVAQFLDLLLAHGSIKCAFGRYTGTGTYGRSNMNTIALSQTPLAVMVMRTDESHAWERITVLHGTSTMWLTNNANDKLYFVWTAGSVNWWSGLGADRQLNESGTEYQYLALLGTVATREE